MAAKLLIASLAVLCSMQCLEAQLFKNPFKRPATQPTRPTVTVVQAARPAPVPAPAPPLSTEPAILQALGYQPDKPKDFNMGQAIMLDNMATDMKEKLPQEFWSLIDQIRDNPLREELNQMVKDGHKQEVIQKCVNRQRKELKALLADYQSVLQNAAEATHKELIDATARPQQNIDRITDIMELNVNKSGEEVRNCLQRGDRVGAAAVLANANKVNEFQGGAILKEYRQLSENMKPIVKKAQQKGIDILADVKEDGKTIHDKIKQCVSAEGRKQN